MKVRTGFVSNSSSSSFVCMIPDDWEPSDDELLKAASDYIDAGAGDANLEDDGLVGRTSGEEKKALLDLRKAINTLKGGGTVEECDSYMEFFTLREVVPKKYIITSSDVSSDCGEIQGVDKNKIRKMLEGK